VKLPRLRRRSPAPELGDRELYPHEYTGPASSFGLTPGPCVIERPWASGYIIRDVAGRRWTVAKKHVRPR
jgi:hypothetical protein